ncbi:MAG: hypothetical protein DRI61_04010, partial [Chloroflexi bacterium]
MQHKQLSLLPTGTGKEDTQTFWEKLSSIEGTRERLKYLLAADLSFSGEPTGYASHNLHAFAAKFPPQLPRLFIKGLTRPGDI